MAEIPIFRFRNTRFFAFGSVPGPGIKLATVESACDVTRLCSASKFSWPLACEQAPKWGLGRKEKSASGASPARSGGERGGGGKRREGACGHSFDAAVSPPCNFTCEIMSHMPIIHARSVWNVNKIRTHVSYLPGKVEMEKCIESALVDFAKNY